MNQYRQTELRSMTFGFSNLFCRHTSDDRIWLDIFCNDSSCADNGSIAYFDTGHDYRVISYPHIIADYNISFIVPCCGNI